MTRHLTVAFVAASLIFAAGAEAKPRALRGVVVHKNHNAKTFVVASAKGRLAEVRSRKSARFARKVSLRATRTQSGAFRTRDVDVNGSAKTALVRGAVTAVDTVARTFTVSANGASILVHLADEAKALPAVGDTVLVTADLTTSTATVLEAIDVAINPAAAAARPIEIEGVVLAIDETTRTLTLSADDEEESGDMIAVVIPAEFDLTKFTVSDSVELMATLNDDGQTFTAVAIDDHDCGDNDHADDDHGDEDSHADEDTHQGGDHSDEDTHVDEDHSGPGSDSSKSDDDEDDDR